MQSDEVQSSKDQNVADVDSQNPADVDQLLGEAIEQAEAHSKGEKSLEERLDESEREVLRARAELENFRKRMQRDSEQQLKYANVPIVRDLIEVMDNLRRAVDAAQEERANVEALLTGVEMVSQQFASVLAKYGCKQIEALGVAFDPNVHEAIAQMPSDEYEAGQVMQEVAVGFTVHDRVVRPSNVIVSTGTASS